MNILFTADVMNQASKSQSLEQGAGLFVVAGFSAGAGSCSMAPSMPSPMLSCKTDPEKVPPNCGWS